jgi:pimeloyl-ACP methyl ester carboxylesterase
LSNRVAFPTSQNTTSTRYQKSTLQPVPSTSQHGLEPIGKKLLHVKRVGAKSGPPAIFVHGLGGSTEYWRPLIELTGLKAYNCILFDLEGHGLSPTTPTSRLSIASFAADLQAICSQNDIASGVTLVAHSLGCLVALKCAQDNPGLVSKLILLGPPPNPLPKAVSDILYARAALVRSEGVGAIVDAVASEETSQTTQSSSVLALSAVRLSLLAQSAEGYAKACTALAETTNCSDIDRVDAETLIITGADDRISSPQVCNDYKQRLAKAAPVEVLKGVGHWHVFEDPAGSSKAVDAFL